MPAVVELAPAVELEEPAVDMEATTGSSTPHATTELSDKPAIKALGAKQGFIACSMSRIAVSRFTGSLSRHCASLRLRTYIDS